MLRWLKGRGARPSAVAEMQARISPELWRQVLQAHPFLAALDDQEGAQLLARSAWLLASKSINGAQGLDVTDAMRLSIAAQASLPILNLTPSLYEGWNEIIVCRLPHPLAPGRRRRGARVHRGRGRRGLGWRPGNPVLGRRAAVGRRLQRGDPRIRAQAGPAGRRRRRHALAGGASRHRAARLAPRAGRQPGTLHRGAGRGRSSHPARRGSGKRGGRRLVWPVADGPLRGDRRGRVLRRQLRAFLRRPWPMRDALPEWYAMLRAYRQDPAERLA